MGRVLRRVLRRIWAPDAQFLGHPAAKRDAGLAIGHHDPLPSVVEDGHATADAQPQTQKPAGQRTPPADLHDLCRDADWQIAEAQEIGMRLVQGRLAGRRLSKKSKSSTAPGQE